MNKLTKIWAKHKPWVVFVVTCKFTSIAIIFYWRITSGPKDKTWLYSLPSDYKCPLAAPSISPPSAWSSLLPKNVYFLETSEQTKPNFLFMCSVESAARVHPEAKIIVLMKGMAKQNFTLPNCLGISLFRCFSNIEIKPLDMKDILMDTPLANWYSVAQQRWEPFFLPVLSDACRLAVMWKFGGIYLDTDVIVFKSLKNLTNTLGIQSKYLLNGAFLSFAPRHRFIELCMQDFVANYSRWIWGNQGPQLFTRVFKKWCSIRSLQSSKGCRGVTVLPQEAFYPIRWQDWRKYFEEIKASELSQLFKHTYAAHVWHKKSQGMQLDITSKALLAQLYGQYCPSTYELMKRFQ
ncbi:lactosylceramide 4-alpha-galactosyltransferase [Sphaerodactylus townsendi]|uniref:lactosylceramide 4-alpha-galactosyltransferase n=1 Tax=Sphaerodactylus townsendi TaxID=933632 RepID=UPI002026A66E|nr:lactosylceramide 4-alpha-galactosyltransferase [Sphaerodactylus townsendi]